MYQNPLCQCKSQLCFPGIFASHGLTASTEGFEGHPSEGRTASLILPGGGTPGCPRVPPRKLICFYEFEMLRDEKNTVVLSFFYFHLQTREMKFDGWKARLARDLARKVSLQSPPFIASV